MKPTVFADSLTFPTSLSFDEHGSLYVAECGLPLAGQAPGGRIWQFDTRGRKSLIADQLPPPVNGVCAHEGALYVSAGDRPGHIIRLQPEGERQVIADGLPGPGNYHVNKAVVGAEGKLYFSQGAMTNTGIVGLDAYDLCWLKQIPHAHDIPGLECVLSGVNVETPDPRDHGSRARTGAFVPFGTAGKSGQVITPRLPCSAAVMRCNLDGSDLELMAWGLRNAYGLAFLPDGRLLATEQGADDRGSRPLGNAPDLLFVVREGAWYGWPDFVGGEPVTIDQYLPWRGAPPTFVLANHDELPSPEKPLLRFPVHAGATRLAVAPSGGAWPGHIFVALFGDEIPMTGLPGSKTKSGRSVARIDPADWSLHAFLAEPLYRPIDLGFHPRTGQLFILDFGIFEMAAGGRAKALAGSGKVWIGEAW